MKKISMSFDQLAASAADGSCFALVEAFRRQAVKEGWTEPEIQEVLPHYSLMGLYEAVKGALERACN